MQISLVLSILAIGALGQPVLQSNELGHALHHNHLQFHIKRARQRAASKLARDTPAESMINELDALYGQSHGSGPSDAWVGAAAQNNPPQQAAPAATVVQPKEKDEVVVVVTTTPQSQSAPSPPPVQVAIPADTQAKEKDDIPVPVVQQPAVPVSQPTQAQPTQTAANSDSGSGNGEIDSVTTDGLPTTIVDNLSTDSAVYKGLATLHHNIHRLNHSAGDLVWNDTLAEWAKEVAQSCIYAHNRTPGGGGYGQNIAAGTAPGDIASIITNEFYNNEIGLFVEASGNEYGNNDPDMSNFEKWGHATQVLWDSTTSFACYTQLCAPAGADPLNCNPSTGQSYLQNVGCGNGGTPAYNTVCNYYPPGNYAGEYSAVKPSNGKAPFVEMTPNGVVGL